LIWSTITKTWKRQKPDNNLHAGGVDIAMVSTHEKRNNAQRLGKHATTAVGKTIFQAHAYKNKRTHDRKPFRSKITQETQETQ
jgi:hypothetical protein